MCRGGSVKTDAPAGKNSGVGQGHTPRPRACLAVRYFNSSSEVIRLVLLMHVLDFTDGEAWIRRVKDRYERPLMEIFA